MKVHRSTYVGQALAPGVDTSLASPRELRVVRTGRERGQSVSISAIVADNDPVAGSAGKTRPARPVAIGTNLRSRCR